MGRRKTNEEFLKEVYENNEYVRRGEIEILSKYINATTKIKCRCIIHDWIYWVAPSSLLRNIGCKKCGRERTTQKQMKSQEQFVAEVYNLEPTTIVIGAYAGAFVPIDFMCSHGHVYSMRPVDFLHGERCPYCASRKILIGYNDIATTRPDVAALFTEQENIHKYMAGSNKKINFTCPLCGKVQKKQISLVSERGFSCDNCSDHLSYPNKFGRALFDQLLIHYQTEWQPDWAKPYYYDIYFQHKGKEYIVELDGMQHFRECGSFGMTLLEQQTVDETKNKLAQSNGIHLIRINCSESKCEYNKQNILQSELAKLFNLSSVDWKLCDEKAQKTLVKTACDLYMSGMKSFKCLCNELHIGDSSARNYIKRDTALGWCDYDPKKANQDKINKQSYKIIAINADTGMSYQFNSMKACERESLKLCGIKFYRQYIKISVDTGNLYNGFMFTILS